MQVSRELIEQLKLRKSGAKRAIKRLEHNLSKETRREIAEARKEIREGKFHRWEEIKEGLKLKLTEQN
jgi:DNA-binding MarR family transcriptional regulator